MRKTTRIQITHLPLLTRGRAGNALTSLRQRVQAHTRASTRRHQARRDAK